MHPKTSNAHKLLSTVAVGTEINKSRRNNKADKFHNYRSSRVHS